MWREFTEPAPPCSTFGVSPDGRQYARIEFIVISRQPIRTEEKLVVTDIDGVSNIPTDTELQINSRRRTRYSPGGLYVVTSNEFDVEHGTHYRVWSVASEFRRREHQLVPVFADELWWSPHDKYLATHTNQGVRVYEMHRCARLSRPIYKSPRNPRSGVSGMRWIRDRELLIVYYDKENTTRILDRAEIVSFHTDGSPPTVRHDASIEYWMGGLHRTRSVVVPSARTTATSYNGVMRIHRTRRTNSHVFSKSREIPCALSDDEMWLLSIVSDGRSTPFVLRRAPDWHIFSTYTCTHTRDTRVTQDVLVHVSPHRIRCAWRSVAQDETAVVECYLDAVRWLDAVRAASRSVHQCNVPDHQLGQ